MQTFVPPFIFVTTSQFYAILLSFTFHLKWKLSTVKNNSVTKDEAKKKKKGPLIMSFISFNITFFIFTAIFKQEIAKMITICWQQDMRVSKSSRGFPIEINKKNYHQQ